MSTELIVPVALIEEVKPHPNADRLEIAQILGWQVVVPRAQHHAGQKVVYFPPDAVLEPEVSDRFGVTQYLSKGRVRCARLRGEPSFGFVVLPDDPSWEVGQNVAEHYRALKYEPPFRPTAGDSEHPHPLFARYTDIENLRNYPGVFQPGEPVVVTEKVHGCLSYDTRVLLADGTPVPIMRINAGDQVLGVDENGRVVPTRVLNKFNNGQADGWLTIRGTRRAIGRGSSFFAVQCTPNHRFWNHETRQYVEAGRLRAGDRVTLIRSERGLAPVQEQVILGKLLGDGYLHSTELTAAVAFGHKESHADYIEWTMRGLGELRSEWRGKAQSGYGSTMIRAHSTFNSHIKETFGSMISVEGRKMIPEWVKDKLGPIAMAFWHMDDGMLAHSADQEDRVALATCAFSHQDCLVLQAGLAKFGIEAVIYEASGWRLRLNADSVERFFLLIAPYVPPSMQYKLPERYRGHAGWLPTAQMPYKPLLVEQTITEIVEGGKMKSARWDIETETHNFFANNVLVHNSNCRIGIVEGEWMAGSMGLRRKRPEDDKMHLNTYWFPYTLPSVRALVEHLAPGHRQVILYGEIYGASIQSFHYGQEKGLGFAAFDLLLDGRFLDWPELAALCARFGVPTVPALYEGSYSREAVRQHSAGKTTLPDSHIREGVVVRPLHERTSPILGRVTLKYLSDAYLLDDKKTDFTDQ